MSYFYVVIGICTLYLCGIYVKFYDIHFVKVNMYHLLVENIIVNDAMFVYIFPTKTPSYRFCLTILEQRDKKEKQQVHLI